MLLKLTYFFKKSSANICIITHARPRVFRFFNTPPHNVELYCIYCILIRIFWDWVRCETKSKMPLILFAGISRSSSARIVFYVVYFFLAYEYLPSMVPGRRPGVPGTQSPAGTPAHGCSAGSGLCISFWQMRTYLPWFRGEGLGFQELGPQLELQHMVAQRVPELNLPADGAAVRLYLFNYLRKQYIYTIKNPKTVIKETRRRDIFLWNFLNTILTAYFHG